MSNSFDDFLLPEPVTIISVALGSPAADAHLTVVPYLDNVQRGVMLLAGGVRIIFGGQDGQPRAVTTFHLLADQAAALS